MKKSALLLFFVLGQNTLAKPFQKAVFQPVEVKSSDVCFSPLEKCDVKLMSFIGLARTQLDIAIFSLTHSGIANAIKQAKETYNVKVRMVVDEEQATADNSKINELKAAGIEIKFGLAKSMTHDKFTIVDLKQVETGSYNYTVNATLNNLENQVYISDEEIVKRYSGEFERMWAEAKSMDAAPAPVAPPVQAPQNQE